MADSRRDNFRPTTRRSLGLRVRFICSRPACKAPTVCASSEGPEATIDVGVAAHICAAAPGGPRYDSSMTPEERRGIENGIWLCQTCASLIDRDDDRFQIDTLLQWKHEHEAEVAQQVGLAAAGLPGFDAEIDAASALYRQAKFESGMDRLTQIRLRHWDQLTPRQRYRTLANIGNGHLGKDEPKKAAALFTEAVYYQPDYPDAQALLARATEIDGDTESAFELAEELVTVKGCRRAAGTYIRCAGKSMTSKQLAHATRLYHSEREVLIALIVRSFSERDLALAADLAATLDSEFSDFPEGPLFAAKIRYAKHTAAMQSAAKVSATKLDVDELTITEQLLGEAHARAIQKSMADHAAGALLLRYHVRQLSGDEAKAEPDLEEASRLAPQNAEVLIARSIAVRSSDRPLAIRLLRDAIKFGGGTQSKFLLALNLRATEGGNIEALELLTELACSDVLVRDDALGLAFETAIQLKDSSGISTLLQAASERDECLCATLRAELAMSEGDSGGAREHAAIALQNLVEGETVASTRRGLAELLDKLGQYELSWPVWDSLVVPGFASPDLWKLMMAAVSAGKHALIQTRGVELREAGNWIPEYVNLEASVLEEYDPEATYVLLTEYLAQFPQDKLATLRWCYICTRIGREAEAIVDVGLLPSAKSDISIAAATARLLRVTDQHELAIAYTYDLLRAHWDDPEAHQLYFSLHIGIEPHLRPDVPEQGMAGAAILYKEVERSVERWAIIEDGVDIYASLGEVRPDSSLGILLVEKRVGDIVTLSDGIEPRRIEILRIEHKYGYHWRKCGEEYQLNFPGRQEIQSFEIGPEGEAFEERFSSMLKAADMGAKRVSDALETYGKAPLTLHALSEALSTDIISCLLGLGADETQIVKTCLGDAKRHHQSTRDGLEADDLVISPSCIGTILAIGVAGEVSNWGWRLKISYSTRDLLVAFIKQNNDPRECGHLGKASDGYAFHRSDVEASSVLAARAQVLLDACEAIPVKHLAQMDTKDRDTLCRLHGTAGAESLTATMDGPAVVWSDDCTFAATSDAFGGLVAGTQAIISAAVLRGQLSEERGDELTAQILGLGYETVWFTTNVISAAARLAGYDPRRRPLSQVVGLLVQNERKPEHVVSTALSCIYEVAQNLELDVSRTAAVTVILESVGCRENGRSLGKVLLAAIPRKFGLSAIRGYETQQTINSWLAFPPRQGT